jgi:hypothetical protein
VNGTYNNLTVGGTTGTRTYTVTNPLTINGNLNFGNANSTIADGGNTITVAGNITGTGKHSGAGKILMTGNNAFISGMTATGNMELNSADGFSLTGNMTVNGALTFTSGKLFIDGRTLTIATGGTLNGLNGTSTFIAGGLTANMTITSTGNVGTLYFESTGLWSNNIATFSLTGNGATVTMGNTMNVSTLLSITGNSNTKLIDNGNTITVSGNLSATTGKHQGTGKISMIGVGGTIQATTGGLQNLELNNAAGFSLAGNTIINGTLTFTAGKLSLLSRTFTLKGNVANMSAANSFTGSTTSTFVVSTAGSTGAIYFDQTTPGTTTNVGTFTNTLGTTTLGSDMGVSTLLTLTAGTFDDGGHTVTVTGNLSQTNCAHIGAGKISMAGVGKTISATLGLNNLEINSASGISLAANTTIKGDLSFAAGKLALLARTLTLKGTVSGMSPTNSITGNGVSSVLNINTTTNLGTLYFDPTTPGVTNNIATLTMNSASANATLGNDVTVLTTLALTAGELIDGGNTITCMGNITGAGTHSGSGKIIMTTATNNSISGATLGNLELNNGSLAFTLTGNTIVNGDLTFTNGSLTIGARTLVLNGAVNNMNDATKFFTGSATSNMVIGGAGTVGPLYFKQTTPLTTNNLASLQVNGGGTVVMGNALSVANMTLNSGKVKLNDNLLTLKTSFNGSAANCLVGGPASSLTLTNTGNLGTLYFDQTTPGTTDNIYTFFQSGNSGTVTIGNGLTISYLLSITGNTATTFNDGGNTIRLLNNVSATNGKHIGTGKLYMTGSAGTIQATVGGLNNVELDNAGSYNLSGNTIINGTLTFTNGTLSLLARTLTIKGAVAGMSNSNYLIGNGATSNLTINSASDIGTLYFDQSTPGTTDCITTFTLSGGATATLGSNMSILTALALTSGTLQDGGNTITTRGSITGAGTHTGFGKIMITNASRSIANVNLGNVELSNAGATTIATGANARINGTLTFTNGTFTIGTGRTLTLNGHVAGMGTTRTIAGSTTSDLVIGSTGSLGDLYFNVSSTGNRTIRNLTINSGATATIKTALIVASQLALADGTINDAGNIITVQGNITGAGIHTSTGSGAITMTGVGKTISGVTLGNLTLNNAAGFSLTGEATVNGTLTLTLGSLTLGANSLTLGASATIAGTLSSSKMIITNDVGELKKYFSAAGSFTYPVGDNTPNYTPVTVSFTGGSFNTASLAGARVMNAKHPSNFNASNYLNRYWRLTTNNIGSPVYDITANYLPADVTGTEGAMSMGQYPDGLPWTKYGTVNTGSHTLTYTGLTNTTSDFTGITTAGPGVFVTPDNVSSGCAPVDLTATGNGDGAITYTWSPATRLSATTGNVVTAYPNAAIVYTVTATDGNGFTAQSTATVVGTINTWQGATSNWNTASNWSCGTVPTATTDVVIPVTANAPVIPASATVSAFNVSVVSSVALTLGASATFNVNGNLQNNSTITGPATAKVVLSGTSAQLLSGNGSVYNLELNNASGAAIANGGGDTVTVKGALTLTSGTLATNNRLMLFANASGTARVAPITGGSITGNVVNQVYVASVGHGAWHFMSHPFNDYIALNQMIPYIDMTGSGGTSNGWVNAPTNNPSAYWIKQSTGGWIGFTNANANSADNQYKRHQGVRIYVWGAKNEGLWGGTTSSSVTIRTYGALNTGDQTITMSKSATDYNQIGNPYASPVDVGTVLNDAYLAGKLASNSYYVWNPAMGTTGQYVAKTIDGTPFFIPAGCSFQVRTADDGNTLTFTEANKGASTSIALRTYADQLTLTIYDGSYHAWDMASVKFSKDASEGEEKIDAAKPESPADLNFYTLSSEKTKLSMDVRPYSNGKVIPLGINTTQRKEFIIKASNVVVPEDGSAIYLNDKYLGKTVLLNNDAEYKFEVTEDPMSQGDNRFELSMDQRKSLAEMISMEVSVMPNPAQGDITVKYTTTGKDNTEISVINVAGVTMITKNAGMGKEGKASLSLANMPAGVYMVSVTCGNEKVVKTLVKE